MAPAPPIAYDGAVPPSRSKRLLAAAGMTALVVASCSDHGVQPIPPGASTPSWDVTIDTYDGSVDAIWGRSSSDVTFAGDVLAHFDGKAWKTIALPVSIFYYDDAWGNALGDIYITISSTIYYWNGSVWDQLASPISPNDTWGAPDGEIFVAGRDPQHDGLVARFDNSSWSVDSLGGNTYLTSVWGTSPQNVYATGEYGLVAHYDGSTWTQTSLDSFTTFYGAWQVGAGPLRVRSSSGRLYEVDGALINRLDPGVDLRVNQLCTEGPDAFVAVGFDGTSLNHGLAYAFDGANWSPLLEANDQLRSGWVSPSGDVFLGGPGLWRVGAGTTERLLGGVLNPDGIYDLWRTPQDDVVAVGTGAYRFDGSQWHDLEKETLTNQIARSVHGRSAHDFYAVGNGMVLHYDGDTWSWVGTGFNSYLNGVWVDADGVTAVGDGGAIVHYDGVRWTRMESRTGNALRAIWGWNGGAIAVGYGGTILRFDGTQWTPMASPVTFDFFDVIGFGPNRMVAVGRDQTRACLYDGYSWQAVPTGISNPYAWNVDLWGTSINNFYMSQDEGIVYHYDGTTWTPLAGRMQESTSAMTGLPGGDLFVAGDRAILRYHRR